MSIKAAHSHTVATLIKKLMQEQGLSTAELARRAEVSQPTLHRILKEETASPRKDSLAALANYFGLSLDVLLGKASPESQLKEIPLLEWTTEQLLNRENVTPEKLATTDTPVSDTAFAVVMNDASMEMAFPKGALLILDPEKKPYDRAYALVYQAKPQQLLFRQLLFDGNKRYLRALSHELMHIPSPELTADDRLLGILAQAKIEY